MSVVLGFGSIEVQEESKVMDAVLRALADGKTVSDALQPWNSVADKNDEMPRGVAPPRYTRIFHCDDKLTFHHVNREHPFSPDGWALLVTERGRRKLLRNISGGSTSSGLEAAGNCK